jgi:DNA-binding transcriptional LysR family regulator
MELRHLRYFIVVAEELHFARAARRLLVSTGGLSRRISHLEEALGAQLVRRTTRSVTLTPFGEKFLPRAARLIAELKGSRAPTRVDLGRSAGD